jgi:hypothetical protein
MWLERSWRCIGTAEAESEISKRITTNFTNGHECQRIVSSLGRGSTMSVQRSPEYLIRADSSDSW